MSDLDRRTVLRIGGLLGVAGGLAACTSGSAPPAASSTSVQTTSTTSPTASSASTSAGASGASTSGSPQPVVGGSGSPLAALNRELHGRLARPGQRSYRPQDLLYNARFGRNPKPQAIAQVRTAADVAACVRFAAAGTAPLHIRNGGHSYGGWSSGSGLVVDLAAMSAVDVDRSTMTATVGAGARLAQVYSALDANGVSIGGGSCATVGVSGLTLGGGVGLLARSYGLTCDQVRAFQVVTADGRIRTVDDDHDPDLFWALRGGGGSFGAVTRITFDVRPAPAMQFVSFTWQWTHATDVLDAWQHWITSLPRPLMTSCRFLVNVDDHVPEASVVAWWAGPGRFQAWLRRLLDELPAPSRYGYNDGFGAMMFDAAGCQGKTTQQCIAYSLAPEQRQPSAAASGIVAKALPRTAIAALARATETGLDVPGLRGGGASFDALGGAVADKDAGATAFPWRSAIADVQYDCVWDFAQATVDPGRYDRFVERERAALRPWLGDSGYSNYADPSLRNFATDYWGSNLARLMQVKKTYDPHNVFAWPQSVPLR